jgi:hypothetical protein
MCGAAKDNLENVWRVRNTHHTHPSAFATPTLGASILRRRLHAPYVKLTCNTIQLTRLQSALVYTPYTCASCTLYK